MLRNIQFLRAVAALLVVVVHLEKLGEPLGLGRSFFDLFAVGVDLFFVISGFIMVHATSQRSSSASAFLMNRVLRIAPLYWVLTLAVFALALVQPQLLGGTKADWNALFRSLAFIPDVRADGTVRPVLFVGWSLNLEMAFYLIFATAMMFAGKNGRIGLGIGMLVAAVSAGVLFRSWLSPELRFLSQPVLLEFAAGMAIGWLYPRLPASRVAARVAVVIGSMALAALLLCAQWPLPGGWPVSLPPAFLAIVAALTAEKGGIVLNWRPFQTLGDASYALYLTHPFVTQLWTVVALGTGILSPITVPILVLSAMVCAMGLGLAIHLHVERPLGRLARKGVERVSAAHTCSPAEATR